MKIGIYDPYLDDLGGGEKYMMTIAQCLSKDNDVSIFWDDKKDVEELIDRFSLNLSKVNIVRNIFSPSTSTFYRIFKSMEFDVIIALSDGSVPLLMSKKIFLHVQQPLPAVEKKKFLTKLKLMKINGIFSNSEYTKSLNSQKFPKSIVIYPPVYLYPRKINKEKIILHVGRFRVKDVVTISRANGKKNEVGDYKKQSFMIEEFKKLVDQGLKDWSFVLATSVKKEDQKRFEDLKKQAEGYPIRFVVNSKNVQLWDLYSRAQIYWHASGFGEDLVSHPEFAEHFGISTVEAMGAGAVPVVINAGGQKEIVTENENGYLWDTPEELEKKTLKLTQDEELVLRLSKSAQERANDFSYNRFCEGIKKLIK